MYIGQRIKELREQRGMKLIELAAKSGVQLATLSRMEHLKMTGTLETHVKIADALGVDLVQLYTNIIREEDKTLHQKGTLPPPQPADIFVGSTKASYEILTSKVLGKRMMPILLKLEPGGKTNPEQNKPGTEKFVYVLDGKIEIKTGPDTFSLLKNNTLYFNAAVEHAFINKGKVAAKVIVVCTPVIL